jgi:autotransporter-associated beta strand protein
MKPRSSLPRVLTRSIAGLIASLAIAPAVKAQTTFTWTNAAGGSWGTTTNWAGGVVASGEGNIADFSTLDITAARTVTLDGVRTIGGLKFGDSNNNQDWTVNVGTPTTSTITLDPFAGGLGTIEVTNRTVTINPILAGFEGLRKLGLGTARLNGANTISGDLVIDGGTLQLGNNAAINGLNPIINVNFNTGTNGGNGTVLQVMDNITIGAGRTVNLITGINGTTQYRASLLGQNGGVWQGDVVISGSSSAGISSSAGTFTISGNITGTAVTFFARGTGTGVITGNINIGNSLFKTDAGTWIINTTGHTWTSATQIADGQLQLGINDAFPTTLPIVIGQGSGTSGRFELNGFNQTVPGLRTDPGSTGLGHIIRNSNFTTASNLTVDIPAVETDILRNTLFQGLGALTLTKTGAGRLELQDDRLDHSNTAVNDGTLAFTGSNNVMVSSAIVGNAAAIIEKSGIGTTTIFGAYNHAGLTNVLDGRLNLGPGNAGAITVGDNTTFGAGAGGGSLTTSSLAFGSFGTTTFAPILGAPGGAPLVNATSLTLSGVSTSVIFEGANITPGVYPLVAYGGGAIGGNGFAGLTLGAPGTYPHMTASLVNNTGAGRVDVNVSAVDSLIWSGTNGNAWDVNTSQNFKLASAPATPATFFQGDRVLFDDTGTNRGISLAGGVRIGNLTFNHSAGTDYTVMGVLTGPGSITKMGTGTTGIGATGVTSITGDGTNVTVTTPAEHGYISGQSVTISNSNVAAFNGTFAITVIDSTHFSFANTTTTANTAVNVVTQLANTSHTFNGSINVSDGVLLLGGSNASHGPVNITGGTLRLANTNAISGGAPVTISNGGTLDVNGLAPNLRILSIHVSGAGVGGNGAIVNNGANIVNLNHALNITLDGDTTWGGSGRYDVNATTTFNGGNFTLTKVGAGELWYTPAAGATLGNVIVNGGIFGSQSNNPLAATSTVTINSGAIHSIFSTVNVQHAAVINDGGTLRSTNGAPVFNGQVTLNGAGTNQTIAALTGTTLNVAGQITGPGGFTKNDTGGTVQIRNSTNNYAGDTVLAAGTLNFSANGVLPLTTNLIINGGTFDPSNLTHTVASLSGAGGSITQATANAGIIVTNQSTSTTFLGAVNRALIRMNGTGTLTLAGTGDNSTGTAEVNSGTLILAKTGTLDVHGVGAAGVGLTINSGATVKLGGPQSGGGTGSNVPPAGAPANYVDQIFNFTDLVMAPSSVLDLVGFSEAIDGLNGTGTIRTSVAGTANSRLYVSYNNAAGQFAGVIENGAGVVELEKLGTSTFILTGANTYTGSTTVTGGALANLGSLGGTTVTANTGTTFFSPGAIGGGVTLNGTALYFGTGNIGGAVTLNGSSMFNGSSPVGGNLTVNGTAVFNGSGTVGGSATINGVYNGGGNITGTLTSNTGSTIDVGGSAVTTISAANVTFPTAATRTLNIGLSGAGADRINSTAANGLALDGTTNVFVQPGAGGWVTGTYPIFGYNGAVQGVGVASLFLQSQSGHSTVSIVDGGTGTINLQVTGVPVRWVGGNGSNWDTGTTLNWATGDQLFLAGDGVRLDDTATTFTPAINANVSPASVTFDTTTTNYVLSGSAGIATGSLWKLGSGTVSITNPNTYTGTTGVQAGTLSAVYASGVVPISAASTIDISSNATFYANSPNNDFTFANTVTGAGTLVIDPNNGGALSSREVTVSGNLSQFTGTVKLSPTFGNGSFRVRVDSGLDLGLGPIDIDDGGQIFYNTSGVAMPNAITITGSGYVETAGMLGALRANNTTFTGPITVQGAAKIGALGATATITNSISGGDLTFGGSNNNSSETLILTGNAGGLTSLTVNDGLATGNANTITFSVGDGGTNGTLGAVPVNLVGDGFKTAAIRFDRSNGYTLGGPITALGVSTRTVVQIDTLGTGFNSNGQAIDLGIGGGAFNVGATRRNAVATVNGILNAGTINVGALSGTLPTRNAVLNLVSGANVNATSIAVASGGNGATLGNTSGATLNISGTATVAVSSNFFIGEQDTSNGFVNQTGGDVTVGGQFRLGHWSNNTSVYSMSAGTLTMTGFPSQFPYQTGVSETNGGLYLGIDGTGVFNQSGGTVRTNFVVLDNRGDTGPGVNRPTGVDTYNLSGGELRITNDFGIISRNPTTAFNMSGGTLVAEANVNLDTNKIVVSGFTGFDTNGNTIVNMGRFGGSSTIAINGNGTFKNADSAAVEAGTNTPFGGGSLGAVNAAIAAPATLEWDRTGTDDWSGVLSGIGAFLKSNIGTLTLSGASPTYTGATTVNGGTLVVNGNLAGSTIAVNAGAILGGTGTTGPVNVLGGSLSPGASPGTLTTGTLTLDSAATLKLELAAAGVVGGVNDLLSVSGNLTLNGTLEVTQLPGFGFGTYRLVNYTGTLTNNILDLESAFLAQFPGSTISTSTPGQVNLIVIPEPGALAGLLGGFGMLMGLQRFRRRGKQELPGSVLSEW